MPLTSDSLKPTSYQKASPMLAETWTCLQDVLRGAAELRPTRRLIIYRNGNTEEPSELTYRDLLALATERSKLVRSIDGFEEFRPILLQLDDRLDFILWFWAVLLANGIPVASSPFSTSSEHRQKHLLHLSSLLESPICITHTKTLDSFGEGHTLRLYTVEFLETSHHVVSSYSNFSENVEKGGLAMLMLTSGTTANAKAVRLTHRQVIAAVEAKSAVRQLPPDTSFLNWVGLDHVASLIEIHIQAMYLGLDQVHVHAADMVSSPRLFLEQINRHRVSRTFAPNFFLAKLIADVQGDTAQYDLSSLQILASGGEANDVETCAAVSELLARHGARRDAVTPGFGMTETCAGAIFNLRCPDYDIQSKLAFASLGKCIEGIEMRITTRTEDGRSVIAKANTPGDLEVRGDLVFDGYYRNDEATALAFTSHGWFLTGDLGIIDSNGNLHLIGRTKEVINIRGLKISTIDVQTTVERVLEGQVNRVVIFPSRSSKAQTENITVAFVAKQWPLQAEEMIDICDKIIQACVILSGSPPVVFSLPDESLLPISTLGKVSRGRMRSLFEGGAFSESIESFRKALDFYRIKNLSLPMNEAEAMLLEDIAKVVGVGAETLGMNTPFFSLGFTSMDLIRLKRQIDRRLFIDIPIISIMKNPTASSLLAAIRHLVTDNIAIPDMPGSVDRVTETVTGSTDLTQPAPTTYDPVVVFNAGGNKTPIWLIHPGVGEVLVFVGLAKHLADDRPIYALRARGFEPGEARFNSIAEAVDVYSASILKRQRDGPYALAGYSYGAMLAFEVAKDLERKKPSSVRFLGTLNLPPHIKLRMRQLNWNMCLLHLAYFLGLVTELYVTSIDTQFTGLSPLEAVANVLSMADKGRMAELGLNGVKLENWANVAFGLQSMAVDFEPKGHVGTIDVFHAIPLKSAAKSREDWVQNHLSRWKDFSETEPRFHEVGGAHYTMLGPEHVVEFSRIFRAALKDRGL